MDYSQIRPMREKFNLSQLALADLLSVSHTHISQLENGHKFLYGGMRERILLVFDTLSTKNLSPRWRAAETIARREREITSAYKPLSATKEAVNRFGAGTYPACQVLVFV